MREVEEAEEEREAEEMREVEEVGEEWEVEEMREVMEEKGKKMRCALMKRHPIKKRLAFAAAMAVLQDLAN